ncbi:hypothetical protein GCM10010447_09570 [Streptomyces fulvorobeus]
MGRIMVRVINDSARAAGAGGLSTGGDAGVPSPPTHLGDAPRVMSRDAYPAEARAPALLTGIRWNK